jgi:hypothetical protein
MGDRCFVTINIHKSRLPELNEHLGIDKGFLDQHEPDDDGVVELELEECNYGLTSSREKAAAAGIPFHGSHYAGGSYGPARFASHGGKHKEAPVSMDGDITVRFDEDARDADCGDILAVREFLDLEKQAEEAVRKGEI